jgi:CheY-like chemotaxis protein
MSAGRSAGWRAAMSDGVKNFGQTAKSLARNPLGIIALFIVLVYGFASLVTAFGTSFTPEQKTPLIYFMVVFPVLVLGVFSWLVSKHSGKLFAPADFENEDNYVRMQLSAVASLAVASKKSQPDEPLQIDRIVSIVQSATREATSTERNWRNRVLWVDDRPDNNTYERAALEAVGLKFTVATSTAAALEIIRWQQFAVIISDMNRREGPREGYFLLDTLRKQGDQTPFYIYAASSAPEHRKETLQHGGQGCTNMAEELFEMVMRSVVGHGAASATA